MVNYQNRKIYKITGTNKEKSKQDYIKRKLRLSQLAITRIA